MHSVCRFTKLIFLIYCIASLWTTNLLFARVDTLESYGVPDPECDTPEKAEPFYSSSPRHIPLKIHIVCNDSHGDCWSLKPDGTPRTDEEIQIVINELVDRRSDI